MQSLVVIHTYSLLLSVLVHGSTPDEDIVLSRAFGASGGVAFSDIESIKFGQKASSISISAQEQITSVSFRVEKPADIMFSHGGSRGTDYTLPLADGEYVNSMEIHWEHSGWKWMIYYLEFSTNLNNTIAAGTKTKYNAKAVAPDGFQLGGFFGRSEGKIYQLGAIWIRINATTKALTDIMGSAWYGNQIRNWVGPTIGVAADSACYRKRVGFGSSKSCPLGYSGNGLSCLAQCPLSYPVSCFEECIPQNDDCVGEILNKAASVAYTVFNTVTAGIFSVIFSSYHNAKISFLCAANIASVIKALLYYLSFVRTTVPEGATEQVLALAYQSDIVLFALPIAVADCLGKKYSKEVIIANVVYVVVENIVKQAIVNGDAILSSANNVFALLKNTSVVRSTDDSTVEKLQDLLDLNTTCGYQLKNVTNYIVASITDVREKTPNISTNDLRIIISNSPLVLKDIPIATNNCMRELMANKTLKTAFETRDLIRKTLGAIVDQLFETNHTDYGQSVAKDDYTLEATNLALVVLGGMDPTGIAWMLSQFIQPTCGPTSYVGEIDDGTLYDALGLKTRDEVFRGSYGTWTKKGDGMVSLIFESTDTKDVSVVIHSGAEVYGRVDVPAGGVVNWTENILKLQDKALYLDRWRRNIVGIPLTTGGSLVLWVPRSSQGGHLIMHVRVNES
ncbi:hypothetical protein PsorP6_008307 [Peronosclerospora sorghi]|uniref:Uncharacterized protein n=1 Tax=Peronosclerospora sorghi TaxID=230839 RepID=A0ACC0W8T3_9STRA|nr:hypothetical protein PsorP6_008307 [Peronosclerospora sorghi]